MMCRRGGTSVGERVEGGCRLASRGRGSDAGFRTYWRAGFGDGQDWWVAVVVVVVVMLVVELVREGVRERGVRERAVDGRSEFNAAMRI